MDDFYDLSYVTSDLFKNCESLGMIEEYKSAMIELIEKEAEEAIMFLEMRENRRKYE